MAALRLIETHRMTMPRHDIPWDEARRKTEVTKLKNTIEERGQKVGDFEYAAPRLERIFARLTGTS